MSESKRKNFMDEFKAKVALEAKSSTSREEVTQ